MPLTQFEMDAITSAVVALGRIADALETIKDRMPQDTPSSAEADACDFPCDRQPAGLELIPCYLWDDHGNRQPCIRKDMCCEKCKRHKVHLHELAVLEKDIRKELKNG